jgi:hypothetical protein
MAALAALEQELFGQQTVQVRARDADQRQRRGRARLPPAFLFNGAAALQQNGARRCVLGRSGECFSVCNAQVKKTKPAPKMCPECNDVVGLSNESVRLHLRLKHPARAHVHLASVASPRGPRNDSSLAHAASV